MTQTTRNWGLLGAALLFLVYLNAPSNVDGKQIIGGPSCANGFDCASESLNDCKGTGGACFSTKCCMCDGGGSGNFKCAIVKSNENGGTTTCSFQAVTCECYVLPGTFKEYECRCAGYSGGPCPP